MFHLICCGRENLRQLTKESLAVLVDAAGKKLVYQVVDELDKNHKGNDQLGDSPGEGRIDAVVPVRVSINKLYLVPKRIMAGVVGVLRNGGGLGTGELYISVMLFDSLVHRSPCFHDVDFTALTENPVNLTILFSRIDGVLRSHQM